MGNTDEFITTAEKEERKEKALKAFKIAIFLAFVLAAVGIGFGVYGIIEVVQKNNQIAELQDQINNDHGVYPEADTSNNKPKEELDGIDINTGQKVSLFHFVSIAENDATDRYSLVMSKTVDNLGFFSITHSDEKRQTIGTGTIEYDGEKLRLKVDPYTESNFALVKEMARDMGFDFIASERAGDYNYYYLVEFDENIGALKLGDTELIRVE